MFACGSACACLCACACACMLARVRLSIVSAYIFLFSADIDECTEESHSCNDIQHYCNNTVGNFTCHCNAGYEQLVRVTNATQEQYCLGECPNPRIAYHASLSVSKPVSVMDSVGLSVHSCWPAICKNVPSVLRNILRNSQ